MNTDITRLNPEDILVENWQAEYKKGIGFFFLELVELNVSLYLANKIIVFPHKVFNDDPNNNIFFNSVIRSFYQSIVLFITRLVADQSKDLYTLLRFKNLVLANMKPPFQPTFKEHLRSTRFNEQLQELMTKAKDLRHNRVAHTTQAYVNGDITVFGPNFSELELLRDKLNSLLDAISSNTSHAWLPFPYHDDIDRPGYVRETDLDAILNKIAKGSRVRNLPESSPDEWSFIKSDFTEEQLGIINEYRRRFGLPVA